MRISIEYDGGIDTGLDDAIDEAVGRGTLLGSGCMMIGNATRDLRFEIGGDLDGVKARVASVSEAWDREIRVFAFDEEEEEDE